MGAGIGLVLGLGLFLVWWSCWDVPAPPEKAKTQPTTRILKEVLAQAGFAGTRGQALISLCAMAGALAFALVWLGSNSALIGLCFAVIAAVLPIWVVKSLARRRRVQLREIWPEVVDHLHSGIRAGLSLPEALAQVGEKGPELLRPPFQLFGQDFSASGNFADSLDALKYRLADPVADRIIEALRVTRDVGGTDLGNLLRTLSLFLREDARTRAELEARQSWTVNAARLALAAPWIVLGLMATRPEAAQAYNSTAGATVLLVGAIASVLAYQMMLRIARLPQEARVMQ